MAPTAHDRLNRRADRSQSGKDAGKQDAKAARRAVESDGTPLLFGEGQSASADMKRDYDGSECTDQEEI